MAMNLVSIIFTKGSSNFFPHSMKSLFKTHRNSFILVITLVSSSLDEANRGKTYRLSKKELI